MKQYSVYSALMLVGSIFLGEATSILGEVQDKDVDYTTLHTYKYPVKYRSYAQRKQQDTAVIIVGYNRPYYFKKMLDALAANKRAHTLPFFFILDGGHQAKQLAYKKIIKDCLLKDKHVIARPFNYGLHWNVLAGLRFMFDWCGFNRIIHFEDDLIVTPTYLDLVLRLDEWAQSNYDNIGAVQCYTPCRMSVEEKKGKLAQVGETGGFWLGYCMHRKVWNDIKDIIFEYERKFLRKKRSSDAIIKPWMYEKLSQGRTMKAVKAPNRRWEIPIDPYYTKLPEMGTGQCGVLTMSFFLKGYSRLTTLVSRGLNIGAQGANYTPDLWKAHFEGITLEHFEKDISLSSFIPYDRFVY